MGKCNRLCFSCLFDDCILTENEAGLADGKAIRKRKRNKESAKRHSADYYKKNKEKISMARKEYYQRNKERISTKSREYQQKKKMEKERMVGL